MFRYLQTLVSPHVLALTADGRVLVRATQEVRQRDQQRGQTSQQSSASDEPRPMDPTPEETHKDDEHRVPHLDNGHGSPSLGRLKRVHSISTASMF